MGDGDEMEREREWRGRGSRVVAVTMAGGWQTTDVLLSEWPSVDVDVDD